MQKSKMTIYKCPDCNSSNVTERLNQGKGKKSPKYKYTLNCRDCGHRFNKVQKKSMKKR